MTARKPFVINKGDVLLLAVAAVWGGSYLVVKELGHHSSVQSLLALRFIFGGLFLWLFWLRERTRIQRREVFMSIGFGLGQVTVLSLETSGVQLTSATNAGLIISLAIIFTPILESVWRKSWLPAPFFIATVIVVVGLALLITGNGLVAPNLGDLLVLIAAILRTTYVVIAGHLTQDKPISALNITALQLTVAAIVMFALNPVTTINTAINYTASDWGLMLFLSLLCTAFGFVGMAWGIKNTSASRTSLLLGTEPVWATIVAVAIGGELMGPLGIVGALLIIGGTFWGQAVETRHRLGSSSGESAA